MPFSSLQLSIILVAQVLFSNSVARAEYMNWSYHWSIGPAPVLASGTGTVSQALGWPGNSSSRILAAAVTTSSDASASDPDRFHNSFALTLHLTDRATHRSGSLTFQGLISGTLSVNSAHLSETFTRTLEHLRLGDHVYWVELPSHLTLLPPGAPVVPYYYATVCITNVSPPPPYHPHARAAGITLSGPSIASVPSASTPEPTSLVLLGLGTVLLGGAGLTRNRRILVAGKQPYEAE
jgi:hypothetical protein